MINFKFNRRSCLEAVTQKLSAQLGILRDIPTKLEVNPFSSLEIMARTKICKVIYLPTDRPSDKITKVIF